MGRMIRIDDEEVEVKEKTIINFVLDESGSMLSRQASVIEGFNKYIRSMRQERVENRSILVTLTKFNTDQVGHPQIRVEYLAKDIDEVPLLDNNNYTPSGGTPLYDAIGETVVRLNKELKGEKGEPGILFVIMTDGEENESKEWKDKAKIAQVIQDKETEGWTFVYLGADQNAWAQAGAIGLNIGNVMSFHSHAYGQTFDNLAHQTQAYYRGGSLHTRSFFSGGNTTGDVQPPVVTNSDDVDPDNNTIT